MRVTVHRAEERGRANAGWLTSRYSFSFANWYEPSRMGFGVLRVINDDQIAPQSGFGMHPHKDMEIITVVTKGAVTHKDSAGNTGIVREGGVQVMSAGTGVVHSEYNESPDTPLELFQIWIEPKIQGSAPYYAEQHLDILKTQPGIRTFVLPRANIMPEALGINQDVWISIVSTDDATPVSYEVHRDGNGVYAFVIDGEVTIEKERLLSRDAVAMEHLTQLSITSHMPSRVLIFDVPMK
jgi:quercetin 2,3-dioxygenase